MGVHDGHRDRLRKRFLADGFTNFEPHNVLELLLFYSVPRRDTNALAHTLIDTFGGFDKVLEADYEQLRRVKGVTDNTAALLKAVFESYGFYERMKRRDGFVATSASAVMHYCESLFVSETVEKAYLLCFDSKLKLINCALLSEGSVNAASVSARKAVEIATANRAVSVILTHNHPRGIAAPSQADLDVTRTVMRALATIDIELCDHVVVGETFSISMANEGVIYGMQQELRL